MSNERFKPLTPEDMTPAQRRLADAIVAGPRGSLRGPFPVYLRSPKLGDIAQQMGAYVRFESVLPPLLRELAILCVARHWTAQYEWYAHRELALQAGMNPAIPDAIAAGRRPDLSGNDAIVYNFATELLKTTEVSDANFNAAHTALGEQGVVDLIGTIGYYGLVAITLNVNRTALPPGVEPLRPLARQ